MKRKRLAVAGVSGLLMLGACGGNNEGAAPLRTVPSTTIAPMTTTAPVTTPETGRGRTTTTVRPRSATTTPPRPEPRIVDGVPQLTATPGRAAVGARVHVEGSGFTDAQWQGSGKTLWLTASSTGCALYASAQNTIRVTADGHLSGDFVVPATGECRQSDVAEAPVTAGTYRLAYSCTACFVGTFTVT